MSGSYYALNAKYNSLLALINSGGGGGGAVNNPMTNNLNGGGYDILAVDTYSGNIFNGNTLTLTANATAANMTAADSLNGARLIAPEINDTDAPSYVNLGAIVPNEYELARIPTATDAEGSILMVLRGVQLGFKQTVFIQVIGYSDKSVIRILDNLSESDTPIFGAITYGEDLTAPGQNVLGFTCVAPSTSCEVAFYQNQSDKGTGVYGSPFVPASSLQTVAGYSFTYATQSLTNFTAGTTGNWEVGGSGTFGGILTAPVGNVDQLTDRSGGGITLQGTDLLCSGNSIKNANNVETSVLLTPFVGGSVNLGSDLNTQGFVMRSLAVAPDNVIKMESSLDMLNGDLENVSVLNVDSITKASGAGQIDVNNELDMNSNKITQLAAPTANQDAATKLYVDTTAGASGVQNPMVVDLNGGGFGFTNADEYTTTAGGVINSNGDFLHNFQTGANLFTVGGDIITFNPQTELKITSTNQGASYIDYTQATRTLSVNDNAVLDCKAGSVLSTQIGNTTTFAGSVSHTGNDIGEVGKINALAGADTGMTATGTGNIVMTTDAQAVVLTNTGLEVQEGTINQTTTLAQGAGTAGGNMKTNGVKGRVFDGALAVYNPPANDIMDGRNHDFLETYNTQFAQTDIPAQTPSGRGSFGFRCRAVINPTANQFISFRIIPQASQSTVNPVITYSRLCFQGNGIAPTGWENDNLTSPPLTVNTPALQVNRFLEGSELFLQAKCVYALSNQPAGTEAALTYIVSYSGVESDGNPVSGQVRCAWTAPIPGVNKFSFEVCAESVGGVSLVDNTELFNDGFVSGSLF
jgi:hypothetical protein